MKKAMANSELYKPIHSIQIKGFTHTEIQGTPVPSKNIPFKVGHIPQFSVVAIERTGDEEDENRENNSLLRKISGIHGRSYEFVAGKNNAIIFSDEFGNIFTQLNTKGNNITSPEVCKSHITPSGFMFYGLQESDEMVRILKASELLRSHNVETEMIVKAIEPAELPYDGQNIPLPEFKRKLVQNVWEENAEDGKKSKISDLELATREDIPKLSETLDNMIFFKTVRATQVNERLADFEMPVLYFRGFEPMLRNAFRYVNAVEKIKAEKDPSYTPEHFSIDEINDDEDADDITRYFNEYLPKRAAHNFAEVHKLGLILKYPHTGNISAVGSIYDLDSVQGEPLGLEDKTITIEDIVKDVQMFLNGHRTGFPGAEEIAGRFVNEDQLKFKENFLKTYVKEMGWEGDLTRFVQIFNLFEGFRQKENEELNEDLLNYYIDQIIANMNLYPSINPAEIISFIAKDLYYVGDINEGADREQIIALFMDYIRENLALKVVNKYLEEDPEAGNEPYGLELINSTAKLFAKREIDKLNYAIVIARTENEEEMIQSVRELQTYETIEDYIYPFYQKLIRQWGWEEDVVKHADKISDLFGLFFDSESDPYLEYYRVKTVEQLGWDFEMDETVEEIIETFQDEHLEFAKRSVEKALENSPEEENRKTIIKETLEPAESEQSYFNWDYQQRYDFFVIDYLDSALTEKYSEELEKIEKDYGKEQKDSIIFWLGQPLQNKFIDIPEDKKQEIENIAKSRIEELKRHYLNPNDHLAGVHSSASEVKNS